jgi:hypothetical protein
MRSHLLLMDKNISHDHLIKLLKDFLHNLLECEDYSFIY